MTIPPNTNTRTLLNFSCVDASTNRQFCHIKSVSLVSIGKNVDGFFNEYKNQLITGSFLKKASVANFYNDSLVLDLGILTNTSNLIFVNSQYHINLTFNLRLWSKNWKLRFTFR